ncbi:hypothetical protein, partial [Sphingomonas sp. 66-10]|uniref:hypothetical protein n=1 Tax=Sphingomonas sp. 66-10 TaxID=1895848 RepID=UPI0025806760
MLTVPSVAVKVVALSPLEGLMEGAAVNEGAGTAETVTAVEVAVVVPPGPVAVFSRTSEPVAPGTMVVPVPIAVPLSSQRRPVTVPLLTVPSVAVKVVELVPLLGAMDGAAVKIGAVSPGIGGPAAGAA